MEKKIMKKVHNLKNEDIQAMTYIRRWSEQCNYPDEPYGNMK